MTVGEYLNQIRVMDAKIENLKAIINELRDQRGRVMGISYEGERVQTSVHGDAMFSKMCKLMDIEDEYNARLEEQGEKKRQITSEIHFLNSAEEIRVLYLRYIDCCPWEEVAEKTNYSVRHVKRIRDRALQSFEDAFPDRFTKDKDVL